VAGRNPVASPRIVKVRSFTGGAATSSVDKFTKNLTIASFI
jgi:hypothetical protein